MRKLSAVLITLFLIGICITSTAQTVDTAIVGTVTDSTGAIIPNATVTIASSSTGISKRAVTNSAGEYSVTYLTPGTYDVTVSANGFSSSVQKGIVLQINQ